MKINTPNLFIIPSVGKTCQHLFALLIVFYSCIASTQTNYTFKDDIGFIQDETITIKLYSHGKYESHQSNKEGVVRLSETVINKSDSILLSYSFYNLKLNQDDFKNNLVRLNPNISLETIKIGERKIKYFGPNKNIWLPHTYHPGYPALLTLLNDKPIVGIRFRFKKSGIFLEHKSSGVQFKVLLYGFNNLSDIQLNNLLNKTLETRIPNKMPKWFEVRFKDKISDYNQYKYIAFGFEAIDGEIHVKQSDSEDFEDIKYIYKYRDDKYRFQKKLDAIPDIQLILK